jgi:hypothetical protein
MILTTKDVDLGVSDFRLMRKALVKCFFTFKLPKKNRCNLRKFLDLRLICFVDYLLVYLKA